MNSIKAHAKVNIFLKITGHESGYHTLISRFMRVENLYDTIDFTPAHCDSFTLEGFTDIPLESNTIYKAYLALKEYTKSDAIDIFFSEHKVSVSKHIPSQAGLGGGSSDAAAFMRLANEACGLGINIDTLSEIGSKIGADLPFFIYNYPSANVKGFGNIVQAYDEEPLELEIWTPNIACDTAEVYKTFKRELLCDINPSSYAKWEHLDSKSLLDTIADPVVLNDLYLAAMIAYPQLKLLEGRNGWFFSGSGSSFFRIKEKKELDGNQNNISK